MHRMYPVFMSSQLPSNKNNLMTVKNLTENSADLYIYGEIVDNTDWKFDQADVMPDDVLNALNQVDGLDHLNIYINSPGGSVFAGLAIYNMLKRNKAYKKAYIDGVGASMASVIPFAADEVFIPSNAFLMIHNPWTIAMGNASEFRKIADDLDSISSGVMNVYKENFVDGIEESTIQKMMDAETWLSGDEAAKYFKVKVIESKNIAACASEYLSKYNKTPHSLIKSQKPNQQFVPEDPKNEEEQLIMQNELDLLTL